MPEETVRERWDEITSVKDSIAYRIELLRRFVKDFPDHAVAWYMLGNDLGELSRFAEAEEAMGHALEQMCEKTLHYAYCATGELFRKRGDELMAEHWYRKTISQRPEHAHGYVYLGGLLARLGRLAEAEEVHRRGTQCAEGCVYETWYNLGLVLRALERYSEAAECFERALKLEPQYKIARLAKRDVERAMRVVSGGG